MQTELDRLKQAYNKIPRVLRMTSVSAKSADAAAYMHYFEEKVEQVGNVNYPKEARSQGYFWSGAIDCGAARRWTYQTH